MSDISSISINNTIYDLKDKNAIHTSGGTLLDTLNIASIGNTSAPIQILNTNNDVIGGIFQFYDTGRLCLGQTTPDTSTSFDNGERYLLPTPTDHSSVTYYNILTSKNPVSIAQGGTSATTAANAWTNLGGGSIGKKNSLVADDIPELNTSKITAGVLPLERGGTNATTAADALDNLGGVSKSGDTMTGDLILSNTALYINKPNADISASSIGANQYAAFGPRDKNNRFIGYIQGVNYTNGMTAIQVAARKYINNANVDNSLSLRVDASGNRSITVSNSEIWRNALGADDGIWPVSLGGTGASTLPTARKALYGTNLNSSAEYLVAITNQYVNGGWVQLPLATTHGGTGGNDSDWKSYKNSNVFSGEIFYRKIGNFGEIYAYGIKLNSDLTTDSGITLGSIDSNYAPSKGFMQVFGSSYTSGLINVSSAGAVKLYKDRNISALKSTWTIYWNVMYLL